LEGLKIFSHYSMLDFSHKNIPHTYINCIALSILLFLLKCAVVDDILQPSLWDAINMHFIKTNIYKFISIATRARNQLAFFLIFDFFFHSAVNLEHLTFLHFFLHPYFFSLSLIYGPSLYRLFCLFYNFMNNLITWCFLDGFFLFFFTVHCWYGCVCASSSLFLLIVSFFFLWLIKNHLMQTKLSLIK
jgi:hypothetical protein